MPVESWSDVSSSPQSIVPQSVSIIPDMKDISGTSSKHSRNSLIYPRKRPSPHGVTKCHKTPLHPIYALRKSPRSARSALIQQRQRDAAALALRREGILLEDEYRDEIRCYMHDMEVGF